jgi:hypothetical protein
MACGVAKRCRPRPIPAVPADGEPSGDTTGRSAISRERLAQRILSTIHNNSILLCGGPGTGKASFLLELKDRLLRIEDPSYRFYPVYVDLRGVPEHRFFGTMAARVREQLGSLSESRPGDRAPDLIADYSHRELARELRLAVQTLGERIPLKVKIVLLVNSIETLERYHPRTSQRLRGLFMTNLADHLVMVASAVAISRRWDKEGSPWYNFFEELHPADGE